MKREFGVSVFVKLAAVAVVVVMVAGVLVSGGFGESVDAQTGGEVSGSVVGTAGSSDDTPSKASGVAAVPLALPFAKSGFVGSVLHKRTVGMERFDTDHDVDGADGVDREIFGSHYVMGNAFKVRIPASYADKPEGVFGFSFNHIVFEVGRLRFTVSCDNQRTYVYRGTSSWRWICSLDFGSKTDAWNSATSTALEVKIIALWSDQGCENGEYGIYKRIDPLFTSDCKALLAIKHYWLDEVVENSGGLSSEHSLWSWGVGDIENWDGIGVGEHYSNEKEFRERCTTSVENCKDRVEFVSLPGGGSGRIVGGIPVEFGGQSGDCNIVKRVLCGLGALQFLDLSGNLLSGGIPAELGNAAVAPCENDKRTFSLDVSSTVSLGLLALALFGYTIPVVGTYIATGASIASLAVSVADVLGYGVEVDLDTYFSGCPRGKVVSDSPYRDHKSLEDLPQSQLRRDVDGNIIAFELLAEVSPDDDFVVRSLGSEWKFSTKAAKAVGGVASMLGAILDAYDVVSGLYKLDRLEYFHEDRSQLVHLDLSGNSLSGAVPAEIGNLERLRRLFLNDNTLSGSLPANVGRSGRAANDSLAVLDLSGNHFMGEVPDLLSSNLQYLDLSDNQLSGDIPWGLSLSLELRHIDLSRNARRGVISSGLTGNISEEIISLNYLEYLDLSHNKLSGDLLSSIGATVLIGTYTTAVADGFGRPVVITYERKRRLLNNLRYFDISYNMLYGEVANNFKNIGDLSVLYLNHNCFHGKVPELPMSIKKYDFSGNFFDSQTGGNASCGPCFDGTNLPVDTDERLKMDCMYLVDLKDSFSTSSSVRASRRGNRILSSWAGGKMNGWVGVELKHTELNRSGNRVVGLDLSFIDLGGAFPSQIVYLNELESLNLSGNKISGDLPEELSNLEDLKRLNLSDNNFMRAIWDSSDDVLFTLTKLEDLNLKNTKLSGELPSGLQALRNLTSLDISENELTGEIPDNFRNFQNLTDLDLSNNMLSGEIPLGVGQGLISIVNLDLSHNRLTGPVPGPTSDEESIWYEEVSGTYGTGLVNLRNLVALDLSYNLLAGEIPENIQYMSHLNKDAPHGTSLEILKLNNNCLTIIDKTVKDIEDADIVLNVDGNLSSSDCPGRGGCSGGVLVEKPEEDAELVEDCEVLLELLEAWSGSVLESWGVGEISDWAGVEVFGGRVVGLRLENMAISGTVPSVIGGLGALKVLDLSQNELQGKLPGEIGDLGALENFDLSSNILSGGLPSRLGRLGRLEFLDLSGNLFSGGIPSALGRLGSLTDLNLSDNRLSGAIPAVSGRMPAGLGRLGRLEFLDLSGNLFSGGIPSALGGLGSLTDLNLSDNRLSGAIPAGLGSLNRLEELRLSGNTLSGGIPQELGDLENLKVRGLDLTDNCLLRPVPRRVSELGDRVVLLGRNLFLTPQDNPMCRPCSDGTFMPSISRGEVSLIGDCYWLVQVRRALHGGSGVPASSAVASWGTAQNPDMRRWRGVGIQRGQVRSLDLSVALLPRSIASTEAVSSLHRRQKLTGNIPAELVGLWALESLDLSNNRFEGAIPAELGSLAELKSLDLSRNRLSGLVPGDLGDISGLVSLDLSYNRLEGAIPGDLGQPEDGKKELTELYLNDNFLTGTIPEILGNLGLVSLYLQYNCLVGATPESLRKLDDMKREPNRGHCADRCSDGAYVASPGENEKLVDDCRALLQARQSWAESGSFPSQAHISNWGAGESRKISDWGGVEVAVTASEMRVIGLALPGNGLAGGIPEELADLDALMSLELAHNEITDPNNGIGKLAGVKNFTELDLSANGIKGQIPTEIGKLARLKRLVLSGNELSGIIPSGPIPVPGATPLLNKLLELEHLDLSDNTMRGLVPSGLTALKYLDLSDNEITGGLPGELFEAEDLEHLDISGNQLAGTLPEKLYDHSNLEYLDISHNRLSGTVKGSFKSLALARLDLSDNLFSGNLPALPLAGLGILKIPHMPPDAPEHAADVYISLDETSSQSVFISVAYYDSGDYRNTVSLAAIKEAGLTAIEIPKMPHDPPNAPQRYLIIGNDPQINTSKRDRNPEKYFTSLTYLDFSRNQFTGPIPIGYEDLADGRPIERLDLSRNQLTGNLPKWIAQITFSNDEAYKRSPDSLTDPEPDTFLVSLEHNQLCTPQNYALADLKRANGETAPADIRLANNECPEDDHASIYVPGPVLNSTYEQPTASPKDMQISWQHPSGQTGLSYIVEPVLKETAPESQPDGENCQVVTSSTTVTITSSDSCEGFDAKHYTANITPVYAPAGSDNRYFGNTAEAKKSHTYLKGWQYRTVQQGTTPQAIHQSLELEDDEEIAYWDGVNQRWLYYSKTSPAFGSFVMTAGSTIAIERFPALADLAAAKLGSADSDTPVLLRGLFTVIPAGGNTTRPAGNNGAWFIDSSLINCSSFRGVTAILRYNSAEDTADVELPCQPDLENKIKSNDRNVTCRQFSCLQRGGRVIMPRSGIDEIKEFDILFITYRSSSPIQIIWENGKYVPSQR